MNMDMLSCRFNTSHVTLYQLVENITNFYEEFQYISCYSLSIQKSGICASLICFNTSHVTLYLFLRMLKPEELKGFNTSHVTLYLKTNRKMSMLKRFNTSHVTLYRVYRKVETTSSGVSIHLMLLFIPRFIGFSSSNSFYNTAKYKGLQDFYQPTYHFLFTHQNLI